MRNFPGPKRGIFCISIVNVIFRSASLFFSLLRASNYHYNKGSLKIEFFTCETIHSLLYIAFLQTILLHWVIKTFLTYIIVRYAWRGKIFATFHSPTIILLVLSCFILNFHGTIIFTKMLNLVFCGISERNYFAAVKKYINFYVHQQQQGQTPNSCYSNQDTTERWSNIGVSRSWWGRSWLKNKSPGFRLS